MAPYGCQVGNIVNLCALHHQELTTNKAKIQWGEDRQFFWLDDHVGLPLNPHPPVSPGVPAASGAESSEANESLSKRELFEGMGEVGEAISSALGVFSEPHRAIPEGEQCPTCKRRVPKKKKEAPKNRVTYSIRVPKDKRENGVELLEDMVAQVETMLGHESARPAYYTLVDALGLMLLNPEILE